MFAAIVQDSYHVPGDERSRTHPGHGYPEHTVNYETLVKFKGEDEMREWVLSQQRSYKSYKLIRYEEIKVETKIEFK